MEKGFPEACFALRRTLAFFVYQKETGHTDECDGDTDDEINGSPAVRPAQSEGGETAENHQNGHQRHHGIDALYSAPVGAVTPVRHPGVEAGVIGRRTQKGHDAVQNNDQCDAQGGGLQSISRQRSQKVHSQEGKGQDGDSPGNISAADKNFPSAQIICQCTHEDSGDCGGHGACPYHQGDIRGGCVEHLVDKYVEVHVFNHPCHLAHEAENHQCRPELAP